LQESPIYRAIAVRLATRDRLELTLRVPLLLNVNGLYRSFSLPDAPIELLRDSSRWSILSMKNRVPAAVLTLERDPARQAVWWIREVATRIIYRGMEVEDRLLGAAESCLAPLDAAKLCIAFPIRLGVRRAAQRRGFVEIPEDAMMLKTILPRDDHDA